MWGGPRGGRRNPGPTYVPGGSPRQARRQKRCSSWPVPRVQPTADVDDSVVLGAGTTIWHLAQIRENAGSAVTVSWAAGAYVGPGVMIGNNVKLQNYALVYEPARLEDNVFIGPAAVLTNDLYPRSVDLSGKLMRPADWDALGVVVREGASLGACAVVVAGRSVGRWALVAAGAVVTAMSPISHSSLGHPRGASGGSATPEPVLKRPVTAGGAARRQAICTRKRTASFDRTPHTRSDSQSIR